METSNDIVAERRAYTAERLTHAHSHAHLIMPLHGELAIAAGLRQHRVNEQTLLFVPSGCEHSFHAAARNEFLVLDIPPVMASASGLPGDDDSCAAYPATPQWEGLRQLILYELEQPHARTALRDLFPYISRCLRQEMGSLPRSIRYIHEHYDEPITVRKLAELEPYNRTYYSEWFVRETGRSPSAYIREVRLNEAKRLLRDSDLPLLQIAIQVGLEHQASLTRLFAKQERLTPGQYRRQYRS